MTDEFYAAGPAQPRQGARHPADDRALPRGRFCKRLLFVGISRDIDKNLWLVEAHVQSDR